MAREISRRDFLKSGILLGAVGSIGGLAAILPEHDEDRELSGCEKIISVEPYHSTRLFITYETPNSQTRVSVHYSNKFRCGDVVIDPRDYLRICGGSMPYGAFDAEKYAEYKRPHNG
ncbi:MAG: twin-arginine translocation signal domain-containing protein [Nanoarchaeota archaeon]|nr:twin-arginine translocation signal domain-containing protein [Nanoarchaeota archaeon]